MTTQKTSTSASPGGGCIWVWVHWVGRRRGNTIRVRGMLYGICTRVWVWVLVRVCEVGDAQEQEGVDIIGSGRGATDLDPNFNFDFDTNILRNKFRIMHGGPATSQNTVEQLHRLRNWWVSGLGMRGRKVGSRRFPQTSLRMKRSGRSHIRSSHTMRFSSVVVLAVVAALASSVSATSTDAGTED
ncbi:uncharacterized protein F5147DRAFT_666118 [Suillus discolor]|uniref:Uncharacterized protein n=1 Tax=Suillus discolor TaxID=1912936 RepID=A0A9P7FIU5_9AGAM|nr:uncharacterized protein F5147DRAFT_666118 [Suillus discolor]KAG2118649.1 hypothetical protein F5147DRAFT_666118 [Suillus discolor]